jgi:hypothetical protein
MATCELILRIDRSIPYHKLTTFPRFWSWSDAETMETEESRLLVKPVTTEEILSLSPRWDGEYHYGMTTDANEKGDPVFAQFPQGTIPADGDGQEFPLKPGVNHICIERFGGLLRDYRAGEAVPGSSVWSKARLSGYLKVNVR